MKSSSTPISCKRSPIPIGPREVIGVGRSHHSRVPKAERGNLSYDALNLAAAWIKLRFLHGSAADPGERRIAIQSGSTRAESATSSGAGRSPRQGAPNSGDLRNPASPQPVVKQDERPFPEQRSHKARVVRRDPGGRPSKPDAANAGTVGLFGARGSRRA